MTLLLTLYVKSWSKSCNLNHDSVKFLALLLLRITYKHHRGGLFKNVNKIWTIFHRLLFFDNSFILRGRCKKKIEPELWILKTASMNVYRCASLVLHLTSLRFMPYINCDQCSYIFNLHCIIQHSSNFW